jgi:hypothetical protein
MFTSRNSCKPMRVLRLAILGAMQGGALLAGSAAQGADQPNKFVMTVFTKAPGGDNIVAGNYQAAIEQTQRAESTDTAVASNQCVAYTMSAQFDAAQKACDTAIDSARADRQNLGPTQLWDQQRLSQSLAIAYSNRSVLDWLSHDNAAAHRDLSKAGSAAPGTAVVSQNVSALSSPQHENAVAQVMALPRR